MVKYLNGKYYPKYFNYTSLNVKNQPVNDYTDDYISENDSYLVILFNDYKDFKGANENDNFSDDIIVYYDKKPIKLLNIII